jgi:leucyl-tRNA synthetase
MGHVRNYTLGDVVARTKRLQGYNVLHPMGWDAFGLPAENAAIQNNSHPGDWTLANITTMREQLKLIGLSYDWEREIATCLPEYYKFEQQFFLKFLEAGIAYRKEAEVNWDPVDNTVLANEQVIEGRGWRSGALVERRKLSQWFLRISDYAEALLGALDGLKEWPEKVRLMQDRWIGKSYGALLHLTIKGREDTLDVYTTRPDTLFGMSFCAISPGHSLAAELAVKDSKVADFIAECQRTGTSEEAIEKAEKKGYDTGLTIIHPLDGHEVALYIANFVLMDYGTGAVFGCPAHDQRDLDFARKYKLPVLPVVAPKGQDTVEIGNEAFTDDGVLVNSDFLNGLSVAEAKKRIVEELATLKVGTPRTNYRLRDWGVSRQRYWGCPIPIIYCDDCGAVPVPEDQLPVELPKDISFDKPGNPLDHHPTWKHADCPKCQKPARRETDTFDTFFESSWYFARYCSPHSKEAFDQKAVSYWMPVDCYIGGIEHAVLHLLYSRFFSRALKQCGMVPFDEPFKRLETQGMICHETYKSSEGKWLLPDDLHKDDGGNWLETTTGKPVTVGRIEKMSKSKKNTVDPRHIMETYGADAARLFMLSDSPPERDLEWTDAGIEGAWRYINRLWKLAADYAPALKDADMAQLGSVSEGPLFEVRKVTHKTIAAVTDDIDRFHFNKAVARIREWSNLLGSTAFDGPQGMAVLTEALDALAVMISPFMPHLGEEMWQMLGHEGSLSAASWPKAEASLMVDDSVTIAVQINGKLRATIELPKDLDKAIAEQKVLELQPIRDALKDKKINKVIVVPNRIVNVVAN